MDFGGFWEPTWEGKSTQDRSKIDPKGDQTEPAARGWTRLHAGAVAEAQGPLLGRIPEGLEY